MKYKGIHEESLKLKVAQEYFNEFDTTKIFGNIDFCVAIKHSKDNLFNNNTEDWHDSILWAEAKKGIHDISKSLAQLILTIGKARTFDKILPPPFLGVFDYKKIAFIHYNIISDLFYMNDFNWMVAPSNYDSKEFNLIVKKIQETSSDEFLIFDFEDDDVDLRKFIKSNFKQDNKDVTKIKITKNNFMVIYSKWINLVKPTINIDWSKAKENRIIDGDFYLADILSIDNSSIKDKLYVLLKKDHYELDRIIDNAGLFNSKTASFSDNQKAHTLFWNKYERPPHKEYWNYIVERRDLLVPQDIRERKGSFFTPQIWVELSHKYLTNTFGENWQDEYYVWDCAAGTGNLLNGLTNKYNIWVSTLDTQDIDVIRDRIKNGANLLEGHVFKFDFLNDDFSLLPIELQKIIYDEEKRKKLIIFINPPYAEHGNVHAKSDTGTAKAGVATNTKTYKRFIDSAGTATRELFAQFFLRIYTDIPGCKLASFSKLKHVNSQNFIKYRQIFKAKYLSGFIIPGNTFDNVKGKFPIGFLLWNLDDKEQITEIKTDIFDLKGKFLGTKLFHAINNGFISSWLRQYYNKTDESIGYIILPGVDMQCQNGVYFTSHPTKSDIKQHKTASITKNNFIQMCIYFSVRHCIEASWINDRDQFLYPNKNWEHDSEFKNDCIIFSLFHSQNRITSVNGINHWIPFNELQVNAKEKFGSSFMSDFLLNGSNISIQKDLFDIYEKRTNAFTFSDEANQVYKNGLALWQYYHSQENINVNASFYEIREYFQKRNNKGIMNITSEDEYYNNLLSILRQSLKILANKIELKTYEYEFLLR